MQTIENKCVVDALIKLPEDKNIPISTTSNTVNTSVLSLTATKSSNKTTLYEGQTATQTIYFKNLSNLTLTDVFFVDNMSAGASYVDGSVFVNDVSKPTFNPLFGFPIGDILPNGVAQISYKIKANSPMTMTPISNYGSFSFVVKDPIRGKIDFSKVTNVIFIEVRAKEKVEIIKSVDKLIAKVHEPLEYTSIVKNLNSYSLVSLFFIDEIPEGCQFVEQSVYINGTNFPLYKPQDGFTLPPILANQTCEIKFKVIIN